jgi:Uncharacterized protein conserved in bacteria (DUF2255)
MDQRGAHPRRGRRGAGDRLPPTRRHAGPAQDHLGRPYRDGLYVRSVNGPTSAWYRGAKVRRQGHIRAGGIDKDVAFAAADPDLNDTLDRITSPEALSTTIQLVPS